MKMISGVHVPLGLNKLEAARMALWALKGLRGPSWRLHIPTGPCAGYATVAKRLPRSLDVQYTPPQLAPQPAVWLGLDVNTHSTGWAAVTHEGHWVAGGLISTKDSEEDVEIGLALEAALKGAKAQCTFVQRSDPVFRVGIEQPLKSFTGGRFNTKGMFKLATVNALACFVSTKVFEVHPIMIHPLTATSLYEPLTPPAECTCGAKDMIETPKTKSDRTKVRGFKFARAHIPADFPWRRTKSGLLSVANFDISDAYLVALAALRHDSQRRLLDLEDEFDLFSQEFHIAYELQTPVGQRRTFPEELVRKAYAQRLEDIPPLSPPVHDCSMHSSESQ